MGYRVVTDTGLKGQPFEYWDATCWTRKDNTLKVGTGEAQYGSVSGECLATFNWSHVVSIEKI